MSSSDAISMTTNADIQLTCHFMRLPTEVREMIYRPLVIARHVMVERSMNSKEYNSNRDSIQNGPDQEYWFETAILATNRRIHEEVRDLCRRENDFICLTSREPSRLGFDLCDSGLQMINMFPAPCSFWNVSMTLTLDPLTLRGWPQRRPWWFWWWTDDQWENAPEDDPLWNFIFCSDELPEFCRLMLDVHRKRDSLLEEIVLYVEISSAIANAHVKALDDHPAGRARMEKLLGPLRRLHGLGAAQIDGPLSGNYKGEIIRSLCTHCPTAMDIVHDTIISLEQADEQASKDQLRQANLGYKAALSFIRSCCWQLQEGDFIMIDGPFPGLKVRDVVTNLEVRLQARIAAVYYKSNKLRMARIYTERALDPRRTYDRGNKIYHVLDIQPWEHVVYAEVLHVAAMTSYTNGNVLEAICTLSQARKYIPFDEEQKSRSEAWQAHADKLQAMHVKRSQATERHLKKRNDKAQVLTSSTLVLVDVVCNWKMKGDRLFRSGRSYLAASVYQAALKKLESLHCADILDSITTAKTFRRFSAVDARKILAFQIGACLAAASLKSRDYEEVVAQTASILKCDNERHSLIYRFHKYCSHSYWSSAGHWAEDQKFEYVRIHYCRAMALYHLGHTLSAAEHMEAALLLDPGDNNVFEKLTMLKQTLAKQNLAKEAARKQRLEKLNRSQIQLRKKQARRKMKA